MILKECMLINNKCYKSHTPAKMVGIVVHDTGAGNPNLKRYVQADPSQSYYKDVQDDVGINYNGNDWNKVNDRYACVHGFIGKNAKGEIETYQTLPYDIACWGVGTGSKGSYNYNPNAHIQFEICDDGYKSKDYFKKVMKEAQEYCAYLCKKFGWNSDVICCHHEAYERGYGGNHADIKTWLKTFGKDMNWFRAEVQKLIDKPKEKDVLKMTEKELNSLIDKKIKENTKVYHYWDELPSWALAPIKAMHDKKLFAGSSASNLNLTMTEIRCLVWIARSLKEQGVITY